MFWRRRKKPEARRGVPTGRSDSYWAETILEASGISPERVTEDETGSVTLTFLPDQVNRETIVERVESAFLDMDHAVMMDDPPVWQERGVVKVRFRLIRRS